MLSHKSLKHTRLFSRDQNLSNPALLSAGHLGRSGATILAYEPMVPSTRTQGSCPARIDPRPPCSSIKIGGEVIGRGDEGPCAPLRSHAIQGWTYDSILLALLTPIMKHLHLTYLHPDTKHGLRPPTIPLFVSSLVHNWIVLNN